MSGTMLGARDLENKTESCPSGKTQQIGKKIRKLQIRRSTLEEMRRET